MTSAHSQVLPIQQRLLDSRGLFIVIMLLGLMARLLLALQTPFWLDELWSSAFSHPGLSLGQVIQKTVDDVHPPLFQMLLYGWFHLFGFTEWSGRLLSLLIGIAAIPLFYLMASAIYDVRTARLATLLFAISPLAVGFSSEVRSYELLLVFSILCNYFFARILKNSCFDSSSGYQMGSYIGYYLFALAIAYTHYFGIILLLCHVISLIVIAIKKQNWKVTGVIVALYCLLALSYLPMMQAVASNLARETFWIKNPGIFELLMYIPWYFAGPFAFPLFVFLGWQVYQQPKIVGLREVLIVLAIVIVLFVPWLLGFIISPVTTLRNCIIYLPFIVLLVSHIAMLAQAHNTVLVILYSVIILLVAVGYTVLNKGEHLDRLLMEVKNTSAPLYFPETDTAWTVEYFNTKIELNSDKYRDIHPQLIADKNAMMPQQYWLACYHKCGNVDLKEWIPHNYSISKEVAGRGIAALFLEKNNEKP